MTLDAKKNDEKVIFTIQQEYKIFSEYKMIESERISGVYVIPSYSNSLLWFGVLFGRRGIYADAIFRFSLLLPDQFPEEKTLPTIIFHQEVIHPLVCPFTQTLNISDAFLEWRSGEDHIWQVLKYMQMIFSDPLERLKNFGGSFSNPKAAKLLTQNRDEYIDQCKKCINESLIHLFDTPPTDDPHYIVFDKFQQDIHGPIIEQICSNKKYQTFGVETPNSTNGTFGLSWVKEGEFKPLSID